MDLERQSTVAEMRFPSQGISLYGTVVQLSPEDITMQVHGTPPARSILAAERVVELVVVAQKTIFMATTEVVFWDEKHVKLGFTAPVRTVQRRREQRVHLATDVNYRTIHENGCYGVWKQGASRDISANGMCLIIAAGLEVPAKMEVLFHLPDLQARLDMNAVMSLEDPSTLLKVFAERRQTLARMPSQERAIKTTARLTNCRPTGEDQLKLGLEFISVSPRDQVRLARYLNLPIFEQAA